MLTGKILIIDDEINVCKMLDMFFRGGGYEVKFTDNPEESLKIYKKFCPDLVLLDIRMPEVDGIEVLKSIRKINNEAKVIIISGMQDITTAKEAVKHGAIDYFPKPIQLDSLDDWIQMEIKRGTF